MGTHWFAEGRWLVRAQCRPSGAARLEIAAEPRTANGPGLSKLRGMTRRARSTRDTPPRRRHRRAAALRDWLDKTLFVELKSGRQKFAFILDGIRLPPIISRSANTVGTRSASTSCETPDTANRQSDGRSANCKAYRTCAGALAVDIGALAWALRSAKNTSDYCSHEITSLMLTRGYIPYTH